MRRDARRRRLGIEVTGVDNGFSLRETGPFVDFVGPHVYRMDTDPVRQHLTAAFICELAAVTGRPVVLEEFGTSSDWASDDNAAHYYRQSLHNSLLAGASGWLAWNNTDYDDLENQDPYRHHPFEMHFGVTTQAGAPKPQLLELRRFGSLLAKVDFPGLRRADAQTALVVPSYLERGEVLRFRAGGNENSRAYLPVEPRGAEVIAVDGHGRPALLRHQNRVLCTYPLEHMAAANGKVNPEPTYRIYDALASVAGVDRAVRSDDPRVLAEILTHVDGRRFVWLVSQHPDEITVARSCPESHCTPLTTANPSPRSLSRPTTSRFLPYVAPERVRAAGGRWCAGRPGSVRA